MCISFNFNGRSISFLVDAKDLNVAIAPELAWILKSLLDDWESMQRTLH